MKISKYQNRILAMVTFFVFFFGLITVIYSDSYQNTLEEQRKKLYGSWNIASYHTSDDEIQTLEKNATIDKVGKVEVLGDILDREGDNIGAIGSADNSFFSLGNIKTLSGHMPRNANEIAIEASYLTRLGYSYELGQNIHLNILFYDKEGNEQIGVYQFVLTGVIKNYSSYWKTQNNELPSFFITKRKSIGTNKNGTITKHIFISLKEKYKEEADALQVLCQRGAFVKNDYVYGEYSGGRLFILERNMLQFFILGIGCITIFLLLYIDLKNQTENLLIMRILGATKAQIFQIYIKKKKEVMLFPGIAGIFFGVALPSVLVTIINKYGNYRLYLRLSWINILGLIVLFTLVILFVFFISIIRLLKLPLRGKLQQQTEYKIVKRRRKLNKKNLFKILNIFQRKEKILSVMLVTVLSAFMLLTVYQTWEAYRSYRFSSINYPDDYTFGRLMGHIGSEDTMTEEQLSLIKGVYGVGKVESVAISSNIKLMFSGKTDDIYLKKVKEGMRDDFTQKQQLDNYIYGPLVGVSDNLTGSYLKQVEHSSKKKLKNNEVILYIPDYIKTEKEMLQVDLDLDSSTQKNGENIQERMIKEGDTVTINTKEGEKFLNIVGVIHCFKDEMPASLNPMVTYGVLCNESTYRSICGKYSPCYVTVGVQKGTIPYQTDIELSKVNTSLYFENNRVEREEQLNNLILKVIMTFVLTVIGLLFLLLIRLGIGLSIEKQKIRRYQTLYQLGMEKIIIWKYFLKNNFTESFFGVLLGNIALAFYRYVTERKNLTEFADYSIQNSLSFYMEICKRCVAFTHWEFLILVVIILILLNFFIAAACDYQKVYGKIK